MIQKHARKGRQTSLMGKMVGLLPGMGGLKEMMGSDEATKGMRQMLGAINSMTPQERRNPKILDHRRRERIAKGAGVQTPLITQLVKQFEMMKPLMQGLAGQGMGDRMR